MASVPNPRAWEPDGRVVPGEVVPADTTTEGLGCAIEKATSDRLEVCEREDETERVRGAHDAADRAGSRGHPPLARAGEGGRGAGPPEAPLLDQGPPRVRPAKRGRRAGRRRRRARARRLAGGEPDAGRAAVPARTRDPAGLHRGAGGGGPRVHARGGEA